MQVADLEDVYRLSPIQQGMLSHRLCSPEHSPEDDADVVQLGIALSGPLSLPALKQAWERVVAHHTVLRTSFRWEGLEGGAFQLVHRRVELPWEFYDWRGREADVPQFLAEDRARRLDLTPAPPFRLSLLQTGPEEHFLVWTHHRLLLDSESATAVAGQALALYEALARGEGRELAPGRSFREHVEQVRQQDLTDAERFWRQELAGAVAPAPLGSAAAIPGRSGCAEQTVRLTAAVTTGLGTLARYGRFTVETMAEGAWAVLLSQRTGARDVLFGITVSDRSDRSEGSGPEPLIGTFRHTLPLRVTVEAETPLLTLLRRVQERQAAVRQHGHVPLSKVQEWSTVPGAPLFHSQLVFMNPPAPFDPSAGAGVKVGEVRWIERFHPPLTLTVRPGAELALTLIYDRTRFDEPEALSLLDHFKVLLERFAADPLQRLSELEGVWSQRPQRPAPAAPEPAKPAAQAPAAPAEKRDATSAAASTEIEPAPRNQPLPATFYQEWALQLDRVERNSLPSALMVEGPLDFTALRRTLAEIVRRHESLRTSFDWQGGEAYLIIVPPGEVPLPVIDLASLPEERRMAVLDQMIALNANHEFDMRRGPLFIARIVRLGERQHALLMNTHHLISDGWSLQVFQRELFLLYTGFTHGRPSPLPVLPVQPADFAHWQRRIYAGEALAAQLAWWRQALANLPPPPSLPIDLPRPEVVGFRAVVVDIEIPAGPTQALRAFAQASRCSLSMVLLTAIDALLYSYSGEEDLVVTSIFAARNRRELAGLIGLFMNTVPVRVNLAGNPTFRGLTGRARDAMVDAYDHQDVPFPRLLAELFPGRKLTRTILSGVCFNMMTFAKTPAPPSLPAGTARPGEGLKLSSLLGAEEMTKLDLVFTGQETENRVGLTLQGAADLFLLEGLQAVGRRFLALLTRVAADPDVPLDRLRAELEAIPG
jgi:non-ribosomal peptide synthetase component F